LLGSFSRRAASSAIILSSCSGVMSWRAPAVAPESRAASGENASKLPSAT
jgi:hypothetical protein